MKPRILIVEDEDGWRQFLADMLGAYDVVEAASVNEARAAIDTARTSGRSLDLVILDLGLSKIGGTATGQMVLDHLRQFDTQVPCIVITGRKLSIQAADRLFRKYNVFTGLSKGGQDEEAEDLLQLEQVVQAALASARQPVQGPVQEPEAEYPAPPPAAVKDLLLSAFTRDDLLRFCRDRADFQPIVAKVSPAHALQDIVDRVIEHCGTHLLWEQLLTEVEQVNRRQYERFEIRLRPRKT